MAQIKGIEDLTISEINEALDNGAKFITFHYTISIIFVTLRKSSDIYFLRKKESTFKKSLKYNLRNLFLGWWGFPWGPIYTIESWITNARGGKDLTTQVSLVLNQVEDHNQIEEDILDEILME